jgi:hypothetical protein
LAVLVEVSINLFNTYLVSFERRLISLHTFNEEYMPFLEALIVLLLENLTEANLYLYFKIFYQTICKMADMCLANTSELYD